MERGDRHFIPPKIGIAVKYVKTAVNQTEIADKCKQIAVKGFKTADKQEGFSDKIGKATDQMSKTADFCIATFYLLLIVLTRVLFVSCLAGK